MATIMAISGSARRESVNSRLLAAAAEEIRKLGADVEILDMRAHVLPLYDEDLETELGVPPAVMALKEQFRACRGIVFACPEYNSAITPLLKNVIDWCSRPVAGEPPMACFKGKTAGLLAGSPGAIGGLRGLYSVRSILMNIGMYVLPTMLAVPKAHTLFDDSGKLTDDGMRERIAGMMAEFVDHTQAAGRVSA